MSLFRKTRPGSADVERIKSEVTRLAELLDREAERSARLEAALGAAPATPGDDGRAAGDVELAARLDGFAEQLGAFETRLTSVSTELAAQLDELGGELAALGGDGSGIDPALLDGLRDGQSRLANEQARYQIAFREDLARLAEQLRRR